MGLLDTLLVAGIFLVVAGLLGGGLKLAGSEIKSLGPGRSALAFILGLLLIGGQWMARESEQFKVVSAEIRWNDTATFSCSSVQAYTGSISTTGKARATTYQVVAGTRVVLERTVTPDGTGRLPVTGTVRLTSARALPPLTGAGVTLRLVVLAPNQVGSPVASLAYLRQCGAMQVVP
jgi:hypothetical protein